MYWQRAKSPMGIRGCHHAFSKTCDSPHGIRCPDPPNLRIQGPAQQLLTMTGGPLSGKSLELRMRGTKPWHDQLPFSSLIRNCTRAGPVPRQPFPMPANGEPFPHLQASTSPAHPWLTAPRLDQPRPSGAPCPAVKCRQEVAAAECPCCCKLYETR